MSKIQDRLRAISDEIQSFPTKAGVYSEAASDGSDVSGGESRSEGGGSDDSGESLGSRDSPRSGSEASYHRGKTASVPVAQPMVQPSVPAPPKSKKIWIWVIVIVVIL